MTDYLKRITTDTEVLGGKPVIRGTRVPVDLILDKFAQGITRDEILADYPHLTEDDLTAVLYYAKWLVTNQESYPAVSK